MKKTQRMSFFVVGSERKNGQGQLNDQIGTRPASVSALRTATQVCNMALLTPPPVHDCCDSTLLIVTSLPWLTYILSICYISSYTH